MATQKKAVMAYVTEEERAMLKALSLATGKSDSKWIASAIREAHASLVSPK